MAILADSINNNGIYAVRAESDMDGNRIDLVYAKKTEVPSKTSDLTNDSNFVTSSDLATVAETGSYADLSNKPDLSVYATTSAMETALAGKQATIPDLDTIRAGAAAGATAAQPSDLPSSDELVPSATSGDAGKVLTVDAQGDPSWVTPSGGTVYTPGDGIDITSDVISADVDGTTIGIDSTTKKIKSLQVIPTKTSDLQNDSNFVVASSLATVATSGSYADLSNKPTIPSVDQTYNASSSNAQSGTAVAQAIAAIPAPSVDEVPDVTSSDDGKVLTAEYSGGIGSYSWQPASGGGSIYTAGDGIAIDSNNEISVAYNSDTLDIAPSYVNLTPHQNGSSQMYQDGTDLTNWVLNGVVGETLRVKIPSMAFLTDGSLNSGDTMHIAISDYLGARFYSTALSLTSWGPSYLIDEQTVDIPLPVLDTTGWGGSMAEYPIDPESPYIRMTFARVNSGSVLNGNYAKYFGATQQSIQIANLSIGKLSVKNPLPASTSSVANCVLKVDANGNPKWLRDEFTNTAGVTDIQVVNSLPAYPGPTVLYLIPET